MSSRRRFLRMASGLAGTFAVPQGVLGANDRVRVGIIGLGDRGQQLLREARACANTDVVAVADVYTRRLDEARRLVPGVATCLDYRQLLENAHVDAVVIATPQHLHGEQFVASLEAGKHVYQERTMAFTVAEARRMRAAYRQARGAVVQIGHQTCSSGLMADAALLLQQQRMGVITAIVARMFRNTPQGKPQWSRPVYPDMTAENLGWAAFLGQAPEREFDPYRYANWRLFWDYSGGNVHENLSQTLAFWYQTLHLDIPQSVTMTGDVYLWKDGREVPDTMNVTLKHEGLMVNWTSGFGNSELGVTEDVLGTEGTIHKGQQIRYLPQRVNHRDGQEVLGRATTAPQAHMQNFLDGIRLGTAQHCPFEAGFRVSVACRMAVDSYRLGRTVRWDAQAEEIT